MISSLGIINWTLYYSKFDRNFSYPPSKPKLPVSNRGYKGLKANPAGLEPATLGLGAISKNIGEVGQGLTGFVDVG